MNANGSDLTTPRLTLAEELIRRHGLDRAFHLTMAALDDDLDDDFDTDLLFIDLRTDSDYQDLLDDLTDIEIRQN